MRAKTTGRNNEYIVFENGDVWGIKINRFLKPTKDKGGYHRVHINSKLYSVHKLVMESFKTKRKPGFEINHKDNNPSNNSLGNLEWVTPKGNSRHAMLLGRKAKKLNKEQIVQIKEMLSYGKSQYAIAKEFGINQSCVSDIFTGVAWSWVN